MRSTPACIATATLVLALAACGGDDDDATSATTTPTPAATAPSTTEAATDAPGTTAGETSPSEAGDGPNATVSPDLPDVYQGDELWDLHLVDPDNRQPVDFAARRQALASLQPAFELADRRAPSTVGPLAAFVDDLLNTWPDGRIKLWLTARLLRLRQSDPHLFLHGSYMPLHVEGPRWARVVAFARFHDNRGLLTVVSRLSTNLLNADHGWPVTDAVWQDTVVRIPDSFAQGLRNVVTGESPAITRTESGLTVGIGDVLRTCPIAVLVTHPR